MDAIKFLIKKHIPFMANLVRDIKRVRYAAVPPEQIFSDIYHKNRWGDVESRSGPGSSLARTEKLRAELAGLTREIAVKSFLDIPCGDFNWMKEADLGVDLYIGADIVAALIELNRQRFGNSTRRFEQLDITKDALPAVDLIFCRDCWVHFAYGDIFRAVANIQKGRSKFLLATTFVNTRHNLNTFPGGWRPLNLQIAPFHFPPPFRTIADSRPDGLWPDKRLALWRIADLPVTTQ